jgi:hypothetical protein
MARRIECCPDEPGQMFHVDRAQAIKLKAALERWFRGI